jgi:hypothetical protein
MRMFLVRAPLLGALEERRNARAAAILGNRPQNE